MLGGGPNAPHPLSFKLPEYSPLSSSYFQGLEEGAGEPRKVQMPLPRPRLTICPGQTLRPLPAPHSLTIKLSLAYPEPARNLKSTFIVAGASAPSSLPGPPQDGPKRKGWAEAVAPWACAETMPPVLTQGTLRSITPKDRHRRCHSRTSTHIYPTHHRTARPLCAVWAVDCMHVLACVWTRVWCGCMCLCGMCRYVVCVCTVCACTWLWT